MRRLAERIARVAAVPRPVLIVGERGPEPKAVPTFPELTCHSVEDFHVLNAREKQPYTISQEDTRPPSSATWSAAP